MTRMKSSIVDLLKLMLFAVLFVPVQNVQSKGRNKVILLLLDGMRWDLFGEDMPALQSVEHNGIRLEWLDTVFPSMSSPSMFSIATGLYPESHQVVHNEVFTDSKQLSFHWSDGFTKPEFAYWWDSPGVEPVWVTAIQQGLKAGSIQYPGGELPIHNIMPTKHVPNTGDKFDLKNRIDIAMGYITEDDFDLVFLYWVDPDEVLHGHGIGSSEMHQKLQDIDEGVRYLFERLHENGLEDTVDVLITSDHGMTQCDERMVIQLYEDGIIDPRDIDFMVGEGSEIQIKPLPGKIDKVLMDIKRNTPLIQAYKSEEMDERFHYGKSPRNLPIIGIAAPGWAITTNRRFSWGGAHHGYDNQLMDMKAILFAQGPSFKNGYRARNMESINIYPLICEILHLTPNANNGSRENYHDMLAEPTPLQSTPAPHLETPPHPSECGTLPKNKKQTETVRALSLVVMCLTLLSLVLGVTTIYYCGKYGLCKRGMFCMCESDDEYRSHRGFISLANDIDMDEDDEV